MSRGTTTRTLTCGLVFTFAAALPAPAAASLDPETVLATVGREEIPVAAIEADLDAKVIETKGALDPRSPDERRAALDRLVERRLFYLGALSEIPGARAVADSVRHHERLRAAWMSLKRSLHPGPSALTPEAIEQFREERAVAWHGRHILVNTDEDVNEALGRLEAGESFGEVAKAISIDIGSAGVGGQLFPLRKGDWYPQLMALAFDLHPGQYGGPVTSRLGHHIMKCDSVSYAPEDPQVFTLYELRRRRNRMAEFDGLDELIATHVQELGIRVDPALVDSALRRIQPVGNLTKPPRKEPGWTPPPGALAVSALGDTMTIEGYFTGYEVLLGYDWPVPKNRTSVLTSIERLMVAHVLRRRMDEGTYDPGPVARAEIDAAVHRHLGTMYIQQVLDPGPVDSTQAEHAFREHPEAFLLHAQASVAMLGVSSAAYADSVERWLEGGMSFADAGRRAVGIDEGAWYNRPTPLYPKGQFPEHDDLVFSQLEVGGVSPRERSSTGFQYYHLARREPERPAARLELTLDMLKARAYRYLLHRAREEGLQSLRERHPVEVRESVLDEVLHARL